MRDEEAPQLSRRDLAFQQSSLQAQTHPLSGCHECVLSVGLQGSAQPSAGGGDSTMREEEAPQLSGRDLAYLQTVQELNKAAAASQPFQAATQFGAAAAKYPGGEHAQACCQASLTVAPALSVLDLCVWTACHRKSSDTF